MVEPYPRRLTQAHICDAIDRGATLTELGRRPGFPSRSLVGRWARNDEGFAAVLRQALDRRKAMLAHARYSNSFECRSEALLKGLREGATLRSLLDRPEFPSWKTIQRWRRDRPGFAAELAEVLAAKPRRKRGPRPYDERIADRYVARLAKGETLAQVLADPTMPGRKVMDRWAAEDPGFDHALGWAMLSGARVRGQARRVVTPQLATAIVARLREGASFADLERAPSMPTGKTIRKWMRRDMAFGRQVQEACRLRDDALADEVLSIAEAATPETSDEARRRIGVLRRRVGQMNQRRRWVPLNER
jgi:hypothetical protein